MGNPNFRGYLISRFYATCEICLIRCTQKISVLQYLPPDTGERALPNPSQKGWYLIYLPQRDVRLSWPWWLVTYQKGLIWFDACLQTIKYLLLLFVVLFEVINK